MVPEITKILMATDLSENARHAFGYAASLANRYGAGITVMHVLEDIPRTTHNLVIETVGQEKWNELRKDGEDRVIERIRERLEGFCEEISNELPACPFITDNILVKIGNPVDEIIQQVESMDADLVVVGARGHGGISRVVMGSISRRVLRRCEKPVLVVRLPKE